MMEAGLISQYDGLPDLNKFQSYLCLNGMGTSRNIGDDTIKKEVTDDAKIDQFERAIYRNKKNGVEGKEYKFDFDRNNWYNPADWFGLYDKLYEGTIYIPITESVLQTHLGAGTSVSQKQADTMEAIYQEGNLRRRQTHRHKDNKNTLVIIQNSKLIDSKFKMRLRRRRQEPQIEQIKRIYN